MAKTSNVFKCPHCDYSTPRKYNLTLHLNKKKPCKPKETESEVYEDEQNINLVFKNEQKVNPFEQKVNPSEQNVNPMFSCELCMKSFTFKSSLKRHEKICKGMVNPLQCQTCKVVFSCASAKSRHVNSGKCKSPESDVKAENEQLQAKIHELEAALTQKGRVVHNTYHITTNNDNSINNTNNNIINYNNFDSPNVDHITKEMIGEMYLKSDRELPRMIGHAVRKIYKEQPENDTIRFKYGNQAGFAEVRQDDETRILPVSDVLETVLSKTSTLCGKELQKCCGPNMIPGPGVANHAQELSVLHWGFVPETQAKRQGFFKFVKSALL